VRKRNPSKVREWEEEKLREKEEVRRGGMG
jgi:hypothetical protein